MNCFHLSIHLQLAALLKQLWGRAPCGVGFPGGSAVKNLPARQEMWVQFLGWQDPLEKEKATHSSILAWEIHGQRNLAGYSPWSPKESGAI